jgi:outer membrane protein OmpA-like peptidoglycan-associated protein
MQGSVQTQRIRRRRWRGQQVTHPGIPGADNRWFPSQGQARAAALRVATQMGLGFSIVHDPRPARGLPHYHVVNAVGRRFSGHFFYGRRKPHKEYRDRPWREYELSGEFEYAIPKHPRIRVRYVRSPYREMEFEAFDPSPPPRGTTLLTDFASDSSRIRSKHHPIIRRIMAGVIARVRSLPPLYCIFIEVEGHEDELGDPARFRRLGAQRAIAVTRVLLSILGSRLSPADQRKILIEISTAGPARPIRSNVTASGRAMNRRVEIRTREQPCGPIA